MARSLLALTLLVLLAGCRETPHDRAPWADFGFPVAGGSVSGSGPLTAQYHHATGPTLKTLAASYREQLVRDRWTVKVTSDSSSGTDQRVHGLSIMRLQRRGDDILLVVHGDDGGKLDVSLQRI